MTLIIIGTIFRTTVLLGQKKIVRGSRIHARNELRKAMSSRLIFLFHVPGLARMILWALIWYTSEACVSRESASSICLMMNEKKSTTS